MSDVTCLMMVDTMDQMLDDLDGFAESLTNARNELASFVNDSGEDVSLSSALDMERVTKAISKAGSQFETLRDRFVLVGKVIRTADALRLRRNPARKRARRRARRR